MINEAARLRAQLKKLQQEFDQYKRESVKWGVEDFLSYEKYKISKKKAQEALEEMIRNHDAEIGITWNTVEMYLSEYGRKLKDKLP